MFLFFSKILSKFHCLHGASGVFRRGHWVLTPWQQKSFTSEKYWKTWFCVSKSVKLHNLSKFIIFFPLSNLFSAAFCRDQYSALYYFLSLSMTSATSFLPRLIQHSLLMISNFFLTKFPFLLNSSLTMCSHRFSKTPSILSSHGPIYGSFPFLYPSARCCLSPIRSLLNHVSTLLATQTFLKFVHAPI